VVAPRQAKPLAEAMLRYYNDEDLRKQMGEKARAHIGNYFNTARSVREMKQLYESLVQKS
jgi:glycosyltransferase involved in cell wall biosynthesis